MAIISLMIALLLPAVQNVRESANRIYCKNHVKQQSLAWHLHATQHGYYPTNGVRGGVQNDLPDGVLIRFSSLGSPLMGSAGSRGQTASWLYQILPYIEQENLWRQTDAKSYREARLRIIATPVPTLFCPSRPREQVFSQSETDNVWYRTRALNDYAVNRGRDGYSEGLLSYTRQSQFQYPAVLNEASILDGLSSTLFISERSVHISKYQMGKNPLRPPTGYVENTGFEQACLTGWVQNKVSLPVQDTDPEAGLQLRFGSPHSHGINAGFGDGSVRTITYTISPETWIAIGGRHDGGIPGPDLE
jgi:prepilin-type processing-associated H-X9-DG protein